MIAFFLGFEEFALLLFVVNDDADGCSDDGDRFSWYVILSRKKFDMFLQWAKRTIDELNDNQQENVFSWIWNVQ